MILQIRKLLQNGAEGVQDTLMLDVCAEDFPGYEIEKPVQVQYVAQPEHGELRLNLQVDALIKGVCARCLQPVEQTWQLEEEFLISRKDLAQEFSELPFTPGGGLDLKQLVYENLVMDVPGVLLCNEDCAGLCSCCGKPSGECGLKDVPRDTGDPRLQVLRQLLSDDSNELS